MMHPPCPGASLQCCLCPMKSLRRRENTLGLLSLQAARGNGSLSVPNKMSRQQLRLLPLPNKTMQMCKNPQCVNYKYTLILEMHLWDDGSLQEYLGGSIASVWGFWCGEHGLKADWWVGPDPGSRGLFQSPMASEQTGHLEGALNPTWKKSYLDIEYIRTHPGHLRYFSTV